MRRLAELDAESSWVLACREGVTAALVAVWFIAQACRQRPSLPALRIVGMLLAIGVLIEVVGNLSMQWAMGVVGLAVTVPAVFGTIIVVGTLLGRLWLAELVSRRSVCAMGVLLIALVLLGLGVQSDGGTTNSATGPLLLFLGVVAGIVAGATFALLNTSIRYAVTQGTSVEAVAFLVPFSGVISLGPLSICRFGWASMLNTTAEQYLLVLAGGLFNLLGFVSFIKGLQRTTVAHANAVNASQVALAAITGMTMFGEPPNVWLLSGVVLTILGLMAFDRPIEGAGP